mgnify:CR=1 FL=1
MDFRDGGALWSEKEVVLTGGAIRNNKAGKNGSGIAAAAVVILLGGAAAAAVLIKKACGIEHASGRPNKDKVANITKAQIKEIAELKMPDLNAASVEAAMSMIAGTARSMGVTIAE